MSFEVFTERRGRPSERLLEVKAMLEILAEDPNQTARIDLDRANIHNMARRLGYNVSISDNKDGTVNVIYRGKA